MKPIHLLLTFVLLALASCVHPKSDLVVPGDLFANLADKKASPQGLAQVNDWLAEVDALDSSAPDYPARWSALWNKYFAHPTP